MTTGAATADDAVRIVLEAFAAVEARDDEGLARLSHPSVTFHWPEPIARRKLTYDQIWDPYQPTPIERSMDPRVVAAGENEVAVVWHQRGVNVNGERLDCEVFGLYEVRDGLLARGQMFYFDTVAVVKFLLTDPPR